MDKYSALLKELKVIRFTLLVYTLSVLGFVILLSFNPEAYFRFANEAPAWINILRISYFVYYGFILWYVWNRYPISKSEKWGHTWRIVILGVFGMWLWFPNSRQRERLKLLCMG